MNMAQKQVIRLCVVLRIRPERLWVRTAISSKWTKAGEEEEQKVSTAVISPLRQGESGYCRHKVFGRGKIVQFLPPDKYRVNFPGMGLKVIMGAYLEIER